MAVESALKNSFLTSVLISDQLKPKEMFRWKMERLCAIRAGQVQAQEKGKGKDIKEVIRIAIREMEVMEEITGETVEEMDLVAT